MYRYTEMYVYMTVERETFIERESKDSRVSSSVVDVGFILLGRNIVETRIAYIQKIFVFTKR